jgi:hypothetical protein
MNWACRTDKNRRLLLRYMGGTAAQDEIIPRVEPSLNRAFDFALGEGLLTVENGKSLALSEKGLTAAEEIDGASDCLEIEKLFLRKVKSFVSERNIDALLTWRLTQ